MSDQSKFLEDVRTAAINTAVEQLRAIYRLRPPASSGSAAGSASGASGGGSGTTPGPAPTLTDVLFDLARIQVNTYNQLLGVSSKYADTVLDRVRRGLYPSRGGGPSRAHELLELTGEIGGEAEKVFSVSNPLAGAATVTFATSEFRPVGGGTAVAATVAYAPVEPLPGDATGVVVEAGATRLFRITVDLSAGFEAARYLATAVALLDGTVRAELALYVDVSA